MKKLLSIIAIFILLANISMVTAVPLRNKETTVINPDGDFSGYIGIPKLNDPKIMGNISGKYKIRNRGGAFNGTWDINLKNKSASGTILGFFGKHIFLGKLAIEGINKTLPVIGFMRINKDNHTFKGRAMSVIGPALYFWGTYQPY